MSRSIIYASQEITVYDLQFEHREPFIIIDVTFATLALASSTCCILNRDVAKRLR